MTVLVFVLFFFDGATGLPVVGSVYLPTTLLLVEGSGVSTLRGFSVPVLMGLVLCNGFPVVGSTYLALLIQTHPHHLFLATPLQVNKIIDDTWN